MVGATGLIGQAVLDAADGLKGVSILAIARREPSRRYASHVEVAVADPARWSEALTDFRPDALICSLGTTWRKAGRDEAAFRAVDHGLVVEVAGAAKAHGATNAVVVSSVGANLASESFYLRVKAEMERDMARLGFARLGVLRPGLLRGERGGDRRLKERAAIALSPLTDRLLPSSLSRFRSIAAEDVARAALFSALADELGVAIHHNDGIQRLARSFEADR